MLSDNIKKNNYCTSDDLDYGIIKLNEDKKCPFLDKCNYCSIYTAIGERIYRIYVHNFQGIK